MNNEKYHIFYYVTDVENLSNILLYGISPLIGEPKQRVYLFNTLDDMIDALPRLSSKSHYNTSQLNIIKLGIDQTDPSLEFNTDSYESVYNGIIDNKCIIDIVYSEII